MDEYNPMEEVGLTQDRQFICSCYGPITLNNSTRNLCSRYLRNGERVFDILSMYEKVMMFPVKAGKEGATRDLMKVLTPLLRAGGVTDHAVYEFSKADLQLFSGADGMVRYMNDLEPCFINTSSMEHQMMCVSDSIGFPMNNVNCSQATFDNIDIDRQESKELREMASAVSKMDVNKFAKEVFEDLEVRKRYSMLEELDSMFLGKMPEMDFFPQAAGITSVGANEKSYALLEIRRQSNIDFDSTFYVGSGQTDHQVLDIVKDGRGLAVSFNGCAETVRNSEIAVISSNAVVITVLAAEFYNEGIEAVHELADNWNFEYLKNKNGPDKHLLNTLLKTFPKKLPEVIAINNKNINDVAEKSDAYRKKTYRN